jgi:hypothetical protein
MEQQWPVTTVNFASMALNVMQDCDQIITSLIPLFHPHLQHPYIEMTE